MSLANKFSKLTVEPELQTPGQNTDIDMEVSGTPVPSQNKTADQKPKRLRKDKEIFYFVTVYYKRGEWGIQFYGTLRWNGGLGGQITWFFPRYMPVVVVDAAQRRISSCCFIPDSGILSEAISPGSIVVTRVRFVPTHEFPASFFVIVTFCLVLVLVSCLFV
jgi:hypothetical protein